MSSCGACVCYWKGRSCYISLSHACRAVCSMSTTCLVASRQHNQALRLWLLLSTELDRLACLPAVRSWIQASAAHKYCGTRLSNASLRWFPTEWAALQQALPPDSPSATTCCRYRTPGPKPLLQPPAEFSREEASRTLKLCCSLSLRLSLSLSLRPTLSTLTLMTAQWWPGRACGTASTPARVLLREQEPQLLLLLLLLLPPLHTADQQAVEQQQQEVNR